ncbi:hypothetical protein KIN20_013527 [Parelaphostrongylus tenuis]|uniref:Uncharacterized protein n=1 Tax=Parelaphostrongylus tenuis TaxID=148309 RepID=A0AAD5QR32_PARTN|nr:hypothetical protein KIN20_013527 [Parelaphostrongylus tenuis]
MARSVSRSRKTASKSPARTRRQVTPKSEPLKKAASKSLSRSRSASRGRKTSKKQSSKKSSRSKSYSRELDALLKEPGEKSTPPRTVRKTSSPTKRAEPKRAYSSSKSSFDEIVFKQNTVDQKFCVQNLT